MNPCSLLGSETPCGLLQTLLVTDAVRRYDECAPGFAACGSVKRRSRGNTGGR
jgi:hypothetical protein